MKNADVRRVIISELGHLFFTKRDAEFGTADYLAVDILGKEVVADYILARERKLQDRIEELEADRKTLLYKLLKIQSEKALENATLKATIGEMVKVFDDCKGRFSPPMWEEFSRERAFSLKEAIDRAIQIGEGKW